MLDRCLDGLDVCELHAVAADSGTPMTRRAERLIAKGQQLATRSGGRVTDGLQRIADAEERLAQARLCLLQVIHAK